MPLSLCLERMSSFITFYVGSYLLCNVQGIHIRCILICFHAVIEGYDVHFSTSLWLIVLNIEFN